MTIETDQLDFDIRASKTVSLDLITQRLKENNCPTYTIAIRFFRGIPQIFNVIEMHEEYIFYIYSPPARSRNFGETIEHELRLRRWRT